MRALVWIEPKYDSQCTMTLIYTTRPKMFDAPYIMWFNSSVYSKFFQTYNSFVSIVHNFPNFCENSRKVFVRSTGKAVLEKFFRGVEAHKSLSSWSTNFWLGLSQETVEAIS